MEKDHLKKIPSVNKILASLQTRFPEIPQNYLKRITLIEIDKIHDRPQDYPLQSYEKSQFQQFLSERICGEIERLLNGSLRKVINATGVVLHTGLGRAPMAEEMADAVKEISRYTNLEIEIAGGKRGQRNDHLSQLLQIITGAEAGFAVNNNAAAVMLMLNSLAKRKEVIISRGEMIEIGGSFRLPEVMKISGVKLKEIGSTNKTHLKDYEEAISGKTGAILICHTSNYEVKGFTAKPSIDKIVTLAREKNIPLIYDMGSGALIEKHRFGYKEKEPLVSELADSGVDLISFSGDKLFGGPQAGFIVGKKKWVDKCAKNHFLRALRLDKTVIKLLQVTLLHYLRGKKNIEKIDSLNAILADEKNILKRSQEFINHLPSAVRNKLTIVNSKGKVGSGAFPLLELPSAAIKVEIESNKVNRLARKFRENIVPIFGRIENDSLLFDLRTVSDGEIEILKNAFEKILVD
jgi:L-seryl-tRNA(Ser) seleniumtransferase